MSQQAPHVIVLDADEAYAQSLASAFVSLGGRSSVPRDGDAALTLAGSDRPDLLVVAAELPRVTGLVVCNKFKRHASLNTVPVLVLVGSTAPALIDEHREMRTHAQAYLPRETPAPDVAAAGRDLIARFPAAPPAPAPVPAAAKPAGPSTPKGISSAELRILDDEIERRVEEMDWGRAASALEKRWQGVLDRAEKLATLEKLLPIYEVETLNGAETQRTAERLLSLVPDHAGAVAALRRAYTRRKDHDRLAELDAHLARVRGEKA